MEILTCPMTGVSFEAKPDGFGGFTFTNPLTGAKVSIKKEWNSNTFRIPTELFAPIKTVTMTQASGILDVSTQRVSKMVRDGVIESHTVNGMPVLLYDDVIEYKENRRTAGRPKSLIK